MSERDICGVMDESMRHPIWSTSDVIELHKRAIKRGFDAGVEAAAGFLEGYASKVESDGMADDDPFFKKRCAMTTKEYREIADCIRRFAQYAVKI